MSQRQSGEDVVVAGACRSPQGRRGGALAHLHPVDLLATVHGALLDRTGIPPTEVDQVVTGCVTQVGEQSYNLGRNAWLAAGLPAQVPASTVDAQCGSSQQAIHLGTALIGSGAADVVVAAGVESMSRVALGLARELGPGDPLTQDWRRHYEVTGQGEAAERIAERWGATREQCDAWALRSQERAAAARDAGRFRAETVPVPGTDGPVLHDEGIRASTTEGLARLEPAFRPDGCHTAGNSSQISDGAAAVALTRASTARRLGIEPLARVAGQAMVAVDPAIKLTGPIPATRQLLARHGLTVDDVDLFEVSEAFASVVLAWLEELAPDPERVNVNGGAIALGHPVGATGARLVTSAVHELARRDAAVAVVTMCCGGGLGLATLLVRD